ncbi:MAG: family 43 glycosylhydrolase [Eubacteriales bacterium]|nr:family 43 glycosylhydrolase [Eubacteriales bacterium]
MKKQAINPFLPMHEYIPDGEPHVFGDRVYLFGSHDKENGDTYCVLDYTIYSASVDNLADWTNKGINYSGRQDPLATEEWKYLYAPDVVQGNDGKFYLYYCLSGYAGKGGYQGPISVAVCDTPDGKYEFYGHVQYADGTLLKRFVPFDPAVMNDDGVIRLYYGTCFFFADKENMWNRWLFRKIESGLFSKPVEEVKMEDVMGAVTCVLEDDMITVKTGPVKIMPSKVKGTEFEGHGFFEASSIRKIGSKYYFIYSSQNNHELCYATSAYPDKNFRYGGVIVSNGDVGIDGRTEKDSLNMIGNNHGSIVNINGAWYVFYHRPTNKSAYSRQACAEPIIISEDGQILQAEMTSCGLNGGPLKGSGKYPAAMCCNLFKGRMPRPINGFTKKKIPYVKGRNGKTIVSDICDGTVIGYKYFEFSGKTEVSVAVRGGAGELIIRTSLNGSEKGRIQIEENPMWTVFKTTVDFMKQEKALYFEYKGNSPIEFLGLELKPI